jgi:hypothetical protein
MVSSFENREAGFLCVAEGNRFGDARRIDGGDQLFDWCAAERTTFQWRSAHRSEQVKAIAAAVASGFSLDRFVVVDRHRMQKVYSFWALGATLPHAIWERDL